MPDTRSNISLYLHIPFCTHRCAYCDFNTYAGQEELIPGYVHALVRELDWVGGKAAQLQNDSAFVHTIFFGGGTPSLLAPAQFDPILSAIRRNFTLTPDAEITIEANPGTCSFEDLCAWRSLGINRISFGVQSANTEELRMLERIHDFLDVIEAVQDARKAGFDNLNLDLIYGLPEQTLHTWQTTVKRVLDLNPEHISAYALTLEHGTPFGHWAARGLMPLPDPDLAAEMYEWLSETLESSGFVQYEISNWAKDSKTVEGEGSKEVRPSLPPFYACRHNLQYWRGLPYLGLGAGAHGYANGYRYSNVLRIKTYLDRLSSPSVRISDLEFPLSPAAVNSHKQSLPDEMSEFMMTGLRLTGEGISEAEFERRFGQTVRSAYARETDELLQLGLIEAFVGTDGCPSLRLTGRARLLGNQVFMRFIG